MSVARRILTATSVLLLTACVGAVLSGRVPGLHPPVDMVRGLVGQLHMALRGLSEAPSLRGLLLLSGISFAYGFVHSAGPGHGKALIASYLLRAPHSRAAAVALPAVTSLTHTVGAIALAAVLTLVSTGIKGMFRIRLHGYFVLANGVIIALIALAYLAAKLLKRNGDTAQGASPRRGLVGVGMISGMVPCPGSLMILLLAIGKDVIWLGLLSVFSVSLGMFALLVPIGIAATASRREVLTLVHRLGRSTEELAVWLEYVSIALILTIGVVMIASVVG